MALHVRSNRCGNTPKLCDVLFDCVCVQIQSKMIFLHHSVAYIIFECIEGLRCVQRYELG